MKAHIVEVLAAAALLTLGAPAHADPITVVAGSASTDFEATDLDLITQGFSVSLFGGRILDAPAYAHLTLGTIEDFSATLNGPLVNVSERNTVIDGMTFHTQSDVLAVAKLQFMATPVLFTSRDITTPFTMTGSLQVFRNAGTDFSPIRGESLVMADLSGSGTLRAFAGSEGPLFIFSSESAAPTPEPATVALIALGLAT